jgi:hypothetical protein
MDGYEHIQGDQAWIRLSDVIWQVGSFLWWCLVERGLISFRVVVQAFESMAGKCRKESRLDGCVGG